MNFFKVKVRYEKTLESGAHKIVTETYLVEAWSVTEAEANCIKSLDEMISGELSVKSVNDSKITDVFDYTDGSIWYICKVQYVDVDEKTGKEKKTTVKMLIFASSIKEAYENLEENLSSMIVPYEVKGISDSNIVDVFPVENES